MSDRTGAASRSSFRRYWTAAVISSFGTAVSAIAMPVLVVKTLHASPGEVGVVYAAQFLPYAVFGLIAGVYVDRFRRKPILVWASIGRALSLGAVPILWLTGVLDIWMLVVVLIAFGAFSVFGFAATQSLLPRLVPRAGLVVANARLDQTDTAASTLGPAIGGALVALVGAPVAIAVDAVSYIFDAALNAGIDVQEPRPVSAVRNIRAEIRDGLRWTYRHPTLGTLAASTHVWFLANGAATTLLSLLALRSLGYTAFSFGLLLTVFGLTSLIGASVAARLGVRFGTGRVVVLARSAYPLAWILVIFASATTVGHMLLFVALAVQGFAAGVENSNEMGYWQALTPDELLGRVNATRRSVNRTLGALGALLVGTAIALTGYRFAIVGVIIVFVAAALVAAASPLRKASVT